MSQNYLDDAADLVVGKAVSAARLRLAMRCVSAAAEANPRLFETDDFRQALTSIGKMLEQKAETPGRRRNQAQAIV